MLPILKGSSPIMSEEHVLGHLTEFAFAMSTIDNPTHHVIRELALKMSNLQRTFFTSLLLPTTITPFQKVMNRAVPYQSGSIFAVSKDGHLVRTKRSIILCPPIPNGPDLFIWVEGYKSSIAMFAGSAKHTSDTFTF